jgi:hypothetical protein
MPLTLSGTGCPGDEIIRLFADPRFDRDAKWRKETGEGDELVDE